jgi:hypothetical protein
MAKVFAMASRVNRSVSMRVHGTSAHVQPDAPPDLPSSFFTVTRVPRGTLITSNYPAHVAVHFSIPTPLVVERNPALHGLATSPEPVSQYSKAVRSG